MEGDFHSPSLSTDAAEILFDNVVASRITVFYVSFSLPISLLSPLSISFLVQLKGKTIKKPDERHVLIGHNGGTKLTNQIKERGSQ